MKDITEKMFERIFTVIMGFLIIIAILSLLPSVLAINIATVGDLDVTGDITVSGDYYGTIGRSAAYFVAATDATSKEIAQADYAVSGYADDEIQDAIDAIAASEYGMGVVKLSSGIFPIRSTINLKNGISLIGQEGLWTTELAGVPGITILKFIPTEPNQGSLDIKNMTIAGGETAIWLSSDAVPSANITLDVCIDRVFAYSQTSDAFIIGDFVSGVGSSPAWGVRVTNCLAEEAGGDGFKVTAAQVYFENNFACNNDGSGFTFIGCSDALCSNLNSRGNGYNGIFFDVSRGTISGGSIINWNSANITPTSSNGSMAINASGADRITITGVTIQNATDATDLKNIGIWVSPSYSTMTGNSFYGSASHRMAQAFYSAQTVDAATITGNTLNPYVRYLGTSVLYSSAVMRNNTGDYAKTVNSGNATVNDGNTSVAVTHGLIATPTRVFLTPINSLGNSTKYYTGNLTGTQFYIYVDINPGATTAIFDWIALVGDNN